MKIKHPTPSTKCKPAALADMLGTKYSGLRVEQKRLGKSIEELTQVIVRLGEEHGKPEGNSTVVHGERFTVGLVEAKSLTFDQAALARLLTPAQFQAVFPPKVVREFDAKAAKAWIAKGKLNSSTLKKGVTVKKSIRVVVKPRKQKGLADED